MRTIQTLTFATILLFPASMTCRDFRDGIIMVCEGQYGADYGSLTFFGNDGNNIYRAFTSANPGMYLGTTAQSGYCFGNNIFVVCKKSAGGGFLTAMDASTLNFRGRVDNLPGYVQAFYFCVVSDEKGYLSTSEGLYIVNIADMTVSGRVESPALSSGMFGQSLLYGNILYTISRRDGIVVIDTASDEVKKIIPVTGAAAITSTADGGIYVATTNAASELVRIFPEDLSVLKIDIPGEDAALPDVWESWHLLPFAADVKENVLYIAEVGNSNIGRYDLSASRFDSAFITLPPTGNGYSHTLYGQGLSVNPTDGTIVITAAETIGDYYTGRFIVYSADPETGQILRTTNMTDEYWFPAQVLYPADAAGITTPTDDISGHLIFSVDIFSISGALILKDATSDDMNRLLPGVYIVGNHKFLIR